MILQLITFSFLSMANAKITTLDSKKEVVTKKVFVSTRSNQGNSDFLRKLSIQNEKLLELLKSKSSEEVPFIWDGTRKIETTKVIRGILLNSVVSTNLESDLPLLKRTVF